MSRNHIRLDQRRWLQVRKQVLDRDGWRCRCCRAYGNEVDHIQPLEKGGAEWELSNLQTLCRGCHIQKTRLENRREPTPEEQAWIEFVDELQR